jgi:uncharacterized protein (DUF58 family)
MSGSQRPPVDPELLKEVRRIQVRTDRLVTDVVSGGYQSVFRGAGIEFDEVREWAEGDDYRSVDWNVTARQGRPFIKKYVEERELTLLFLIDRSRSMGFGSGAVDGIAKNLRRIAVEFVACLGLSASRNNDKVGLVAFGKRVELFVPPKKGRAHLLRILRECLAPGADREGTDLGAVVGYAGHVQRKRAIVFLLSDFCGAWPDREMTLLAKRHDLTLVPCFDPRLETLPKSGLLRLVDLETGEEIVVDAASAAVRAAWQETMQRRVETLRAKAKRVGADWLPLSTTQSVASAVVGFFRRRELRSSKR